MGEPREPYVSPNVSVPIVFPSYDLGADKLWPVGQTWPAACFHGACELRMV